MTPPPLLTIVDTPSPLARSLALTDDNFGPNTVCQGSGGGAANMSLMTSAPAALLTEVINHSAAVDGYQDGGYGYGYGYADQQQPLQQQPMHPPPARSPTPGSPARMPRSAYGDKPMLGAVGVVASFGRWVEEPESGGGAAPGEGGGAYGL